MATRPAGFLEEFTMSDADRQSLFFTEAAMLMRYPVGAIIIAFGIGWVFMAWWTVEEMRDKYPDQPTQVMIAGSVAIGVGVLIVCGGLWFILIRAGTLLDRRTRTVYSLSGPLGLIRRARASFDDVRAVKIRKVVFERRPSGVGMSQQFGKSRHVNYPVELITNGRKIELMIPMTYRAARRSAEGAAKYLGVGIEDATSGETVSREAGTLDESLGEQLHRSGVVVEVAAPPAELEPLVSCEEGQWLIERPAISFQKEHKYLLGITALVGLFGATGFAGMEVLEDGPADMADVMESALLAFALPVGIGLAIVLRALCSSEVITMSAQGLTVCKNFAGLKRRISLPAQQIEQVEIDRHSSDEKDNALFRVLGLGPTVRVVSDQRAVQFGSGRTDAELQWMANLLKKTLVDSEVHR